MPLNRTHDPQRRGWLASANAVGTDFPLQNLPLGSFKAAGSPQVRVGIAIGESVLDLFAVHSARLLRAEAADAAAVAHEGGLAALMALPAEAMSSLRAGVFDLLCDDTEAGAQTQGLTPEVLRDAAQVQMQLPCAIRGYTDFLASEHHTERNGRLKGLAVPVPEAYRSVPVAYHGRASSIVVSGTEVRRPNGQWKAADGRVVFGPADALDFELEMGIFIGQGNPQGLPVKLADAHRHIFGLCLLNDWSSKAVQWWEQMLGPFLGKNFATSISPWIVTQEALEPFRVAAPQRATSHPPVLPYLDVGRHSQAGSWNIDLVACLSTRQMRERNQAAAVVTQTGLRHLCWTPAQMVAHHTSNGCNLETGDLLGTGTISGPHDDSRACMTELTSAGRAPLALSGGESRGWLADGDEVVLRARASAPGHVPIGFGECRGLILPSLTY